MFASVAGIDVFCIFVCLKCSLTFIITNYKITDSVLVKFYV